MSHVPEEQYGQGEYGVQTRRESFTLRGEWADDPALRRSGLRHGITLYPDVADGDQGSIEVLTEDIGKLRVCLDVVEWIAARGEQGEPFEGVAACHEVTGPAGELLARVRTSDQAQRLCEVLAADGVRARAVPVPLTTTTMVREARERLECLTERAREDERTRVAATVKQAFVAGDPISYLSVVDGVVVGLTSETTVMAVDDECGAFRTAGSGGWIEYDGTVGLDVGPQPRLRRVLDDLGGAPALVERAHALLDERR